MASVDKPTEKEVKSTISSILTSTPQVSTIQTIQKDYREFRGRDIPYYLFKCNSVEHFLRNIPDVCIVNGSGPYAQVLPVINEKISHINELVTKQRVNVKGRRNLFMARRRGTPVNNYFGGPQLNTVKRFITPSTINYGGSTGSCNIPARSPAIPNQNVTAVVPTSENKSLPKNYINKTKSESNIRPTDSQQVTTSKLIVDPLSEISKMAGLTQYRTKIGKISPIGRINNSSNCEIPHNAPIGRSSSEEKFSPANNDYKKVEKLSNLSLEPVKDSDDEDISNVPNKVQANLKMLISEFPDGIWAADLPKHYRKQFRKDLSFTDYGYTSLIEMCISLKHIFHYVRPGKDDFKLYDRNKPLPIGADKVYTIASYDTGEKLSYDRALPELEWSDFQGHIPPDAFAHGNEIPNQFIPESSKIEDILDVVVVEIYDPSKFWLYLGTSESKSVLDGLMDDIQRFYNNPQNAQEYAIPPGAVKEGLYCVQIIFEEYHRAKIVRVLPDSNEFVRVLYIDYGTVCKAPIKGMCFLRSNFANVPAQAIRGRLANICPQLKGHPWPRSASDRFRELVNRRETQIKISYIDWKEEYVCVFLADVTDWNNVLYVNETLVKEKHAVWVGEKQISPLVIPNFICKVQNMHLFPTFLELEYGLAPNANEMYSLAEMLVPLQFCIPQYFERIDEVTSDAENRLEEFENCFVLTVKHHRKRAQWNTADFETIIKSPPLDFNIFGDLKDEIMQFCDENGFNEVTQQEVQQEQEPFYKEEETEERDLQEKECDAIQLLNLDKELSENIIKKLETYSILDSDLDNPGDLLTSLLPHESLELDLCKESLAPQNCTENSDLVVTAETQSENNMNSSVDSSSNDVNIFDNPEAFENCSDLSRDSNSPVTPEAFLRSIECKIFDSACLNNDVCDANVQELNNKEVEESPIINVPFKSSIETTKNNFIESLSATNPFREYLENNNFTSSNSIPSEPDETNNKIVKKPEEQSSDSDASDYKSFIPNSQRTDSRFSLGSSSSLPAAVERFPGYHPVSNMRRVSYPVPPSGSMKLSAYAPTYVPTGFVPYQYPQWSNADYPPVNWNNMNNYQPPPPPPPPVRPPPGFTGPALYQPPRPYCPPAPFMTPCPNPAYAYAMMGASNLSMAKDFYDRYNEALMNSRSGGPYS